MVNGNDSQSENAVHDSEPPFLRILWRLLKESAIPLILSAGYATWDTRTSQGSFHFGPFLKVFGPTFFLLMWSVGQFLRVKKHLQDRDLLSGINTTVQTIQRTLIESVAQEGAPVPTTPENIPIFDTVAADMMQQAESALANGLHLPALLMGAATYEHSLREAARRFGIPIDSKAPVQKLIAMLEPHLPTGIQGELKALWDVRNKLVHLRNADQVKSFEDAQRALNSFRWAVALLANR